MCYNVFMLPFRRAKIFLSCRHKFTEFVLTLCRKWGIIILIIVFGLGTETVYPVFGTLLKCLKIAPQGDMPPDMTGGNVRMYICRFRNIFYGSKMALYVFKRGRSDIFSAGRGLAVYRLCCNSFFTFHKDLKNRKCRLCSRLLLTAKRGLPCKGIRIV